MNDHATSLQLDTIAAGLPLDAAVPAHIAACAECQAKLEQVKAQREAVLRSPQFEATLKKLRPDETTRRRPLGLVLAFAAMVLLIAIAGRFLFPQDDTILKGAQRVELLKDGAPVTRAKVGDRLTLAVGAAGAPAVVVFTRDGKGGVEVLVPPTPVGKGARVPVGNVLEVTDGSLTVFACFGPEPLNADALKAKLNGCAQTQLEVVP